MLAEWTAECAEDAPAIVVPWSDAASGLRYIDLQSEPYDLAEISEAEQYPALGRALRSLNAQRSSFLTSKCDAWPLDREELEAVALELHGFVSEDHAGAGIGGYIDLLPRERNLFLSAHRLQGWLDRLVRRAERIEQPDAKLVCTLRPALFERGGPVLEGYAVSLYIYALGPEPAVALRTWELALEDIVALLRGREFEIARGSATIDAA